MDDTRNPKIFRSFFCHRQGLALGVLNGLQFIKLNVANGSIIHHVFDCLRAFANGAQKQQLFGDRFGVHPQHPLPQHPATHLSSIIPLKDG